MRLFARSVSLLAMLLVPVLAGAAKSPAAASAPRAPEFAAAQAAIASTAADTLLLYGGPASGDGKFQDDLDPSLPDDEGWMTLADFEGPLFHVDTFNAELLDPGFSPNHAMWCGAYFRPCTGEPDAPQPGYGLGQAEYLTWSGPVASPGDSVLVNVTAIMNYEMEPGYDYIYFEALEDGVWVRIADWTDSNRTFYGGGVFVPEGVDLSFMLGPDSYVDGDHVHLRWYFRSDLAFSDEDCAYPTDGAVQIDNIAVRFDQGAGPVLQTSDDFEPGSPVSWEPHKAQECSDAAIEPLLEGPGHVPASNTTPQLAFLADGTGCSPVPLADGGDSYGPGGLIVDCEDLQDLLYYHSERDWVSPVIPLPDMTDYDAVLIELDAYLRAGNDEGPYLRVAYRLTSDGLTWNVPRNTAYASFPSTDRRRIRFLIDHVYTNHVSDAVGIQVMLGAARYRGYNEGCWDGVAAPWVDNVAVKAMRHTAPVIAAAPGFEDAVASSGAGLPSVVTTHFHVAAPRRGASLAGAAEIHWILEPNPANDALRTSAPPNPLVGVDVGGTPGSTASYIARNFRFALPTAGFLFPGDRLRYFVRAVDDVAGDLGTALMPADTTGFSDFTTDTYPEDFRWRVLPSTLPAAPDSQPTILVWDGSEDPDERAAFLAALAELGLEPDRDFDYMATRPESNPFVQVNPASLAGYATILMDVGDRALTWGWETGNPQGWLGLGSRNLMVFGNNLLEGAYYGTRTPLIEDLVGAALTASRVGPFIDGQAVAGLVPTGALAGITTALVADGGNNGEFDAMAPAAGQELYAFAAPGGGAGGYPVAGAVLHEPAGTGSRVVAFPIAFGRLATPDGHTGPRSAPAD
ncbi:hypothetical protein KDM41_03415, partial [bacterium]|nr:hypothetical protein [bacterium]